MKSEKMIISLNMKCLKNISDTKIIEQIHKISKNTCAICKISAECRKKTFKMKQIYFTSVYSHPELR